MTVIPALVSVVFALTAIVIYATWITINSDNDKGKKMLYKIQFIANVL
jgi:hypothetical protein